MKIEKIIQLRVVFHEGTDKPFEIETCNPVDLEETICEYWNDMGSDYYNWSLEEVEYDEES